MALALLVEGIIVQNLVQFIVNERSQVFIILPIGYRDPLNGKCPDPLLIQQFFDLSH